MLIRVTVWPWLGSVFMESFSGMDGPRGLCRMAYEHGGSTTSRFLNTLIRSGLAATNMAIQHFLTAFMTTNPV